MTESSEQDVASSPSKLDEQRPQDPIRQRQSEQQRWKCSSVGRSTLLCGGRIVLGGHFLFSLGTLALLAATLVLFVLSALRNLNTAWLLSGLLLWTLSIIFLVQTAVSDPGIIAPDTSDIKPDPPLDFDVGPDGPSHRFCETCNIWRPPRAKHCRVCNNCVRRFDHHCAWLGTCVAERNYRSFVMFVFTTTILTAFVIVASFAIGVPKFRDYDFGDALAQFPEVIVLFFLAFWTFLALASLSVYHCNLISIGQTTNENVRDVYRHRSNPYNKGCVGNLWSVLCGSVSPSALRFSELRDESALGTEFNQASRQLASSSQRPSVGVSVLDAQDRSGQV